MAKNGSAGRSDSRTFWDVTITVGIPFSRWGATPFIIAPLAFPVDAVEAAQYSLFAQDEKVAPHPFELAIMWRGELANEEGLTKAKIAAREGLSRARVTQIMNLLDLPEIIQNVLQHPPEPLDIHAFSERRLRKIVSCGKPAQQLQHWAAWLEELKSSFGPR